MRSTITTRGCMVETRLKSGEMLPGRAARTRAGGRPACPTTNAPASPHWLPTWKRRWRARIWIVLKAANAALDAGTQELATLLIEQAMDEALARRGLV